MNPKTIKEQILELPLPVDLRLRILELTTKAGTYIINIHTSDFRLTQAFDWLQTREGGDYWLQIFYQIEQHEALQKKTQLEKPCKGAGPAETL